MGLIAKNKIKAVENNIFECLLENKKDTENHFEDSFFPPEWFPQSFVLITWPNEDTDWKNYLEETLIYYIKLTFEIASREKVVILTTNENTLMEYLGQHIPQHVLVNIRLIQTEINDTWDRDYGFITTVEKNKYILHDFCFNAWGNKFESDKDNATNNILYKESKLNGTYCNDLDFVLEGGSLESNGHGILLTTSKCLLNANRNAERSKEEIEKRLTTEFSLKKILWLEHGCIIGDDTDAHIDTLARFCSKDTIVYTKCYDTNDEHYEELSKMELELSKFTNDCDNHFKLVPLPLPDPIYYNNERLPATYANFLIINKAVLYPTYNQCKKEKEVKGILQNLFPSHEIIGINSLVILRQHGSLHCTTMQFPKNILK